MIAKAQDAYQRLLGMTTDPRIIADANKRFTLITAKEYAQQGDTTAALKLLNELHKQIGDDPEVIYYIDCLVNGKPVDRCPPEESALAVKYACGIGRE